MAIPKMPVLVSAQWTMWAGPVSLSPRSRPKYYKGQYYYPADRDCSFFERAMIGGEWNRLRHVRKKANGRRIMGNNNNNNNNNNKTLTMTTTSTTATTTTFWKMAHYRATKLLRVGTSHGIIISIIVGRRETVGRSFSRADDLSRTDRWKGLCFWAGTHPLVCTE
jgi:hypothetical protein